MATHRVTSGSALRDVTELAARVRVGILRASPLTIKVRAMLQTIAKITERDIALLWPTGMPGGPDPFCDWLVSPTCPPVRIAVPWRPLWRWFVVRAQRVHGPVGCSGHPAMS